MSSWAKGIVNVAQDVSPDMRFLCTLELSQHQRSLPLEEAASIIKALRRVPDTNDDVRALKWKAIATVYSRAPAPPANAVDLNEMYLEVKDLIKRSQNETVHTYCFEGLSRLPYLAAKHCNELLTYLSDTPSPDALIEVFDAIRLTNRLSVSVDAKRIEKMLIASGTSRLKIIRGIEALGEKAENCAELLIPFIEDPQSDEGIAAIHALGAVVQRPPMRDDLRGKLEELLQRNSSAEVVSASILALSRLYDFQQARKTLGAFMTSEDPMIASIATEAIERNARGAYSTSASEVILALIEDPSFNPSIVVKLVSEERSNPQSATTDLTERLKVIAEGKDLIRASAARCILYCENPSRREYFDAVFPDLRSSDPVVREHAIVALSKQAEITQHVVEAFNFALTELTKATNDSPGYEEAIMKTASAHRKLAEVIIPHALYFAQNGSATSVRMTAIEVLGGFSDHSRATEGLCVMASRGNPQDMRARAISLLGNHQAVRQTVSEVVSTALLDVSPLVRSAAERTMPLVGVREHPHLAQCLMAAHNSFTLDRAVGNRLLFATIVGVSDESELRHVLDSMRPMLDGVVVVTNVDAADVTPRMKALVQAWPHLGSFRVLERQAARALADFALTVKWRTVQDERIWLERLSQLFADEYRPERNAIVDRMNKLPAENLVIAFIRNHWLVLGSLVLVAFGLIVIWLRPVVLLSWDRRVLSVLSEAATSIWMGKIYAVVIGIYQLAIYRDAALVQWIESRRDRILDRLRRRKWLVGSSESKIPGVLDGRVFRDVCEGLLELFQAKTIVRVVVHDPNGRRGSKVVTRLIWSCMGSPDWKKSAALPVVVSADQIRGKSLKETMEFISAETRELCDSPYPLENEFLHALLRKRRILFVVTQVGTINQKLLDTLGVCTAECALNGLVVLTLAPVAKSADLENFSIVELTGLLPTDAGLESEETKPNN